ncbi:hypothetical protein BH09PSE3_BH09PSE3_01740 [soil metagenome]
MLDIAPSELLAVAVIALLVIGPKDLPRVMRVVGQWVGKARAMARHFRSGFDNMIREAELEDMEKKWKEENERIMQAYPSTALIENAPAAEPSVIAAPDTEVPAVKPPTAPVPTPAPDAERPA